MDQPGGLSLIPVARSSPRVVENLFVHADHRIHALEHDVLATLDTSEVTSREGHLVEEWLPLRAVATADLRPFAVRDVLANGR